MVNRAPRITKADFENSVRHGVTEHVKFPRALYREMKADARRRGWKLRQWVREACKNELAAAARPADGKAHR